MENLVLNLFFFQMKQIHYSESYMNVHCLFICDGIIPVIIKTYGQFPFLLVPQESNHQFKLLENFPYLFV
jgi:hypothetical protein